MIIGAHPIICKIYISKTLQHYAIMRYHLMIINKYHIQRIKSQSLFYTRCDNDIQSMYSRHLKIPIKKKEQENKFQIIFPHLSKFFLFFYNISF